VIPRTVSCLHTVVLNLRDVLLNNHAAYLLLYAIKQDFQDLGKYLYLCAFVWHNFKGSLSVFQFLMLKLSHVTSGKLLNVYIAGTVPLKCNVALARE